MTTVHGDHAEFTGEEWPLATQFARERGLSDPQNTPGEFRLADLAPPQHLMHRFAQLLVEGLTRRGGGANRHGRLAGVSCMSYRDTYDD